MATQRGVRVKVDEVVGVVGRLALCVGVSLLVPQVVKAQDLILAENGSSPYRIVIGVGATMQEYYAAQQLQQHVKEISGVELPIVGDDNAVIDTEIIVGFNRHVERLDLGPKPQDFGPEEFQIKTVGQQLIIIG